MTETRKPSTNSIGSIIAPFLHLEGPLLPMLHAIQNAFGHIPPEADEDIIQALNISRAELHGVISFYHDFTRAPKGKCVIKICQAEACQAVGALELGQLALERVGKDWGETTDNGAVTLEPVYCLGLCASGPAALSNDKVVGRVDLERLEDLLQEAGA